MLSHFVSVRTTTIMMRTKALVLAFLVNLIGATLGHNVKSYVLVTQQTPVIGGTCKLGNADVQIGGKQTQFFLKCEATSESTDGQGVWVVKSRSAASGSSSTAPLPQENTQPQQHPKITMRKHNPNICEQDNGARENEMCAVSATCLQATTETPISFLQCEQTSLRWVKKSCQDGFIFNFEQQACVVPKRAHSISPNMHDMCSHCPIGTYCSNGVCTELVISNLCRDGSAPQGRCNSSLSSLCPENHQCTSQGLCCPQTNVFCAPHRRCAQRCPHGMFCSPLTRCCQSMAQDFERRHADPFPAERSAFELSNTILESTPKSAEPLQLSSTTEVGLETTTLKQTMKGSCPADLVTCRDNADCPSSFECDYGCCRLAVCPNGWMVRYRCKHQYHCKSREDCIYGGCCDRHRSHVESVSQRQFEMERPKYSTTAPQGQVATTPVSAAVTKTLMGYDVNVMENIVLADQRLGKMRSSSRSEGEECEIDNSFRGICALENPCSDESECRDGRCCIMMRSRCANTLMPLAFPAACVTQDDCPVGSVCEEGRCCPISSSEIPTSESDDGDDDDDVGLKGLPASSTRCHNGNLSTSMCSQHNDCPIMHYCENNGCCLLVEQCENGQCCNQMGCYEQQAVSELMSLMTATMSSTTTTTVITSTATRKLMRCLAHQRCNSTSLCPPKFTCSLESKCCRIEERCPDATVPESLCSDSDLCPSLEHSCIDIGHTHNACCVPVIDADIDEHVIAATDVFDNVQDSSDAPYVTSEVAMNTKTTIRPIMTGHQGLCPSGSIQVPPRIGRRCRYSLHCPSPYYCNRGGNCCLPK